MFDSTSRYFNLETATINVPDSEDGTRAIRYVQRRIIASTDSQTTLVEHTVAQGERLDQVTARYLSDPTLFWRICDANNVLQPEELEETGRIIKITMPGI